MEKRGGGRKQEKKRGDERIGEDIEEIRGKESRGEEGKSLKERKGDKTELEKTRMRVKKRVRRQGHKRK